MVTDENGVKTTYTITVEPGNLGEDMALAKLAGWPLSQAWLLWSAGLFVFAGLCWLPVLWLQIRVRDMAAEALATGGELPERANRYMRIWFVLGWPAFIAFIVIFWLMVAKPL